MKKFIFYNLIRIKTQMEHNNRNLEQFNFTFNNVTFDCILDIDTLPYELMIGAARHNFACVLYIDQDYSTSMPEKYYYALCRILNLNYSRNHFTSFEFLKLIDSHLPKQCSDAPVPVEKVIPFRKNRLSQKDREEGFIFCGWLPHKDKNNGHARNFDKTEALLGKKAADYCRKNDISSKWTTDERLRTALKYPWEY